MRIDCHHGYFFFREDRTGEVAEVMAYYGFDLVAKDNYYTFPLLESAPDYSLKGAPILGNTATVNYEGNPWEVMEQNSLVFDLISGTVKPIATVINPVTISLAGFYFVSKGLINPGSVLSDGRKVKSYRGRLSTGTWSYRYSEVSYV